MVTSSTWDAPARPPEMSGPAELLALLGLAFSRSSEAMLLVDDNVRTVCANPAAGEMFGTDPPEMVGHINAIYSRDCVDGVSERVALRLSGLDHRERETEFATRAGDVLVVRMSVDVVPTDDGQRFFLLRLRDITLDRRREAALAAGELRYLSLVRNLPQIAVFLFDHDLRLLLAAGESLIENGYDPERITGKLLSDVLPPQVFKLLEARCKAALAGRPADFDYTSPQYGAQFRLRIRPVAAPDGRISSVLATSEDVSAERTRQSQLEQIHRLTPFGSCQFKLHSGWAFDQELLELWGVDSATDPVAAIDRVILPEDRAITTTALAEILDLGGRTTLQYRLRHGKSDAIRVVKSTCDAAVNNSGVLVRAICTHIDVSDAVAAAELAESAEAQAAQDQDRLRRLNDAVAATGSGLGELTSASPSTAEDGQEPAPRVLTQDEQTVAFGLVAHRGEERRLAGEPGTGHRGIDGGFFGDAMGRIGGSSAFHEPLDERVDGEARHFIVAPVRHEGTVLGLLSIFRTPDTPYQPGDEQPVQLLADRVGSTLAESRLREVRDQERVERRAVADRLLELTYEQRELLEQLASTETRERALLADAVHDDPMQLIVAALLRIDFLRLGMAGEQGAELDQVGSLLETSVERLRKLIVAITPPELSAGLGVALRNLAEGIFIGTTSVVTFVGGDHASLDPPVKATAYRIMREALVNARKHAQAKNVTLRLEEHDGTVILSLTDDGVGAESLKAGPGHFGLATMRARANAEGARFHIDSTPGLGTTVVLTMPMRQVGQQ